MSNTTIDLCANYADTNPDISGVGVRVSFYLQTFLLVLLVDRSWQDAPIALWTFIATSAGLTIAAIVQRDNLTLFQALQVSNLVWLANFGTFVALASYSRQKAASHKDTTSRRAFDYKVKFGAMTQTLLSMSLTLYVWTNAHTFGENPECSRHINYVLFVIKVSALGTGRVIGLVVTSILTAAYSVITLRELQSYRTSYLNQGKTEANGTLTKKSPSISSSATASSPHSPHPSSSITFPTPQVYDTGTASSQAISTPPSRRKPFHPRRPKRRRWSSDLDPMLVGIIICQVMVFTYFIVSSEMLLKFNPSLDHSAAQWGFGQILALIVVMPSALALLGAVREHGFKRLSKRKKGRSKNHKRRGGKRGSDIELGIV